MSRDHLERGLDAQRIDPVEGFVQQQHLGIVEGGKDDGHAPAHAMGEAGRDAIGRGSQIETVEQEIGRAFPSPAEAAEDAPRERGAPRA